MVNCMSLSVEFEELTKKSLGQSKNEYLKNTIHSIKRASQSETDLTFSSRGLS